MKTYIGPVTVFFCCLPSDISSSAWPNRWWEAVAARRTCACHPGGKRQGVDLMFEKHMRRRKKHLSEINCFADFA